jgi:hypothetical protein
VYAFGVKKLITFLFGMAIVLNGCSQILVKVADSKPPITAHYK